MVIINDCYGYSNFSSWALFPFHIMTVFIAHAESVHYILNI